jgi:hypothetical protein
MSVAESKVDDTTGDIITADDIDNQNSDDEPFFDAYQSDASKTDNVSSSDSLSATEEKPKMAPTPASARGTQLTLLFNSAKKSANNGIYEYGFVSNVDPGLNRSQFIQIPHGETTTTFSTRASDVEDDEYYERFAECLLYDAKTVASFTIPEDCKSFCAANRAHLYASGMLSDADNAEVIVAPAVLTDSQKEQIVADHDFVLRASDLNRQVGTIANFCCSTNYYQTNHNTAGDHLPIGHCRAIRACTNWPERITNKDITDTVYLAGHAGDKRLTLRSIVSKDVSKDLKKVNNYGECYEAKSDVWAAFRIGKDMLPAGTAIVGILKVLLTKVGDCHLLGISPAPRAIQILQTAFNLIKTNPGSFHPGSYYLFGTGMTVLSDLEDLRTYVGIMGGFCKHAGYCPTIVNVPHIAKLIAERSNSQWNSMGQKFASGVEYDDATFQAAVSTGGVGLGNAIPNPAEDSAGYASAAQKLADEVKAIEL